MGTSAITVSDLSIQPGFGQNFAKWTFSETGPANALVHLSLNYVELWSHTANDRGDDDASGIPANATLANIGKNATIHAINDGVARWYWARAVNRIGSYGPWSSLKTAGVAVEATASIGLNGFILLPSGLVEQWGQDTLFGGTSTTITFPVAFPNQCFNVVANPIASPNTMLVRAINVETYNTTTVLLSGNLIENGGVVSSPSMTVNWRAVGF
jgi:hypothetical protein